MSNFHDHRGVVDNGLNDGLDFLKDIVRQAKEINPNVDYVFVFNQRAIESALYQKDADFYVQFNPAIPAQRGLVYCRSAMVNEYIAEENGICDQTGLSFYQIKMALCRLFANESKCTGSRDRLQRILLDHAARVGAFCRHPVERWTVLFFTE